MCIHCRFRDTMPSLALMCRDLPISLFPCPVCGNDPHWLLYVAQKNVRMFPVVITDFYYFLKCSHCGMIMHTLYQQYADVIAPFKQNPAPYDKCTKMIFDYDGVSNNGESLVGKFLSIHEINCLAESKKSNL